jgi:hypothetical protein
LRCKAKDFFLSLRDSPALKYDQISYAFYVAASVPRGIHNYRILEKYLGEYDKTTLLFFLIYKSGKKLSDALDIDILTCSSEGRKKIADLFALSDEWLKLQPAKDPAVNEKDLVRFQDVTHVDFENCVVGSLKSSQGFISQETFCAIYSFGNYYQPGDVVHRSFGKMDQNLIEAQILYEEKWWLSVVDKKEKIEQRYKNSSELFNMLSLSCMQIAREKGYLQPIDGVRRFSAKSKLIIYFLSFLREEHRHMEPHFSICEHENATSYFDLSTLENKCVLMGLWIRDVLENETMLKEREFEFLITSGAIRLKVIQEFDEQGQLLSEPIYNSVKYFDVVAPKADLDEKEIDRVFEDYFTTLVYREYRNQSE